jgi:hypothetical protein
MKKKKKKKAPRVFSIKRRSQYFERRKNTSTSNTLFDVIPFPPLHHTILKTLSKIIEKIFLTLFGPSFSLAINITRVVPFSFTHELQIFSL